MAAAARKAESGAPAECDDDMPQPKQLHPKGSQLDVQLDIDEFSVDERIETDRREHRRRCLDDAATDTVSAASPAAPPQVGAYPPTAGAESSARTARPGRRAQARRSLLLSSVKGSTFGCVPS